MHHGYIVIFPLANQRDANGVNGGGPDKKSYSESYQFYRGLFFTALFGVIALFYEYFY